LPGKSDLGEVNRIFRSVDALHWKPGQSLVVLLRLGLAFDEPAKLIALPFFSSAAGGFGLRIR
jgi:hypothetical protein